MKCFPLDNTKYEADSLGAWCGTRTRGVFSADTHYNVKANGDMTVTVSPGLAWLKADIFWGVSAFEQNPTVLKIDTADGSLSRLDAICIQLDKNKNIGAVIVKKGAYSEQSPTLALPVCNLDVDEIYVATVLVRAGATEILPVDIDNAVKLDEKLCGIMRDGVTRIPTEMLYNQAKEVMALIQTELDRLNAGTETMLKTTYDPKNTGVVKEAEKATHAKTADRLANVPAANYARRDDHNTFTKPNYFLGLLQANGVLYLQNDYGAGGGRIDFGSIGTAGYIRCGPAQTHDGANFFMANGWYNFRDKSGEVWGTLNCKEVRTNSDKRLKKAIKAISTSEIDKIMQLRPVSYQYKQDDTKGYGFVAQEVREIFPEFVATSDPSDPDSTLSLSYNNFIGLLTMMSQRHEKLLADKNAEIAELKAGQTEILKRLDALEKAK